MFRSTSLRLAALYTTAFVVAVATLGAVTLLTTRTALTRQFNARITYESAALAQEFRTEGLNGVIQAVQERDRTPGVLDYGLEGPGGRAIAGRLAGNRVAPGWSDFTVNGPTDQGQSIRVYATNLSGGYRLLVGGDDQSIEAVDRLLAKRFVLAVVGVVLLGLIGGYALARGMGRRIAAITDAAEAIIDGDLSHRVPVRGAGDDLDHLAMTFNRMLDRIQGLMDSLKQVSSDIAHDLRTPLTRLRTRIETQVATAGETAEPGLEAALGDLDAILETFAALVRIAQIEGGARRAGFRPTDLSVIGRTVVEAFAPSAEEAGATLRLESHRPVVVEGDAELVTQMIVNLVENSLRHAGVGANVRVVLKVDDAGPVLSVVDDGPGIPESERDRVLDRFHRLERSRSTPGSGLGLALAAAVAKLHNADISLHDAGPGLEARIRFMSAAG